MNRQTKSLVLAALFTALCCIATMVIKIPTPGTGGYIHLGDAFVILSGILLGPIYGGLAAGLGSALADLIGGYFVYVPITFVVKGIIGLVAALIYHRLCKKIASSVVRCILCGVFATVFVAAGYLAFEVFIYGAGALASVPANLVQGASGLVISSVLLPILQKIRVTQSSAEYR